MWWNVEWKYIPIDFSFHFSDFTDVKDPFGHHFNGFNDSLWKKNVNNEITKLFTSGWDFHFIYNELNSCLVWLSMKGIVKKEIKIHKNNKDKIVEYKYYKLVYDWKKILYDPYRSSFSLDLVLWKSAIVVFDERLNLLDSTNSINPFLVDSLKDIFDVMSRVLDYFLSVKNQIPWIEEFDQYVVLNFNTRQLEFYPKNVNIQPFYVGMDNYLLEDSKKADFDFVSSR